MSDTFQINKGSDFSFQFNWKNSDGTNANLTGYTVALVDVSASLSPYLSIALTTASTGLITTTLNWHDSISIGKLHSFRIQIAIGSTQTTTNLLYIEVV